MIVSIPDLCTLTYFNICFASIIVTAIILFFKRRIVMISHLEKALLSLLFTQIIPAFDITTFSKFVSLFFCVRALDSLINYFFMNFVDVFEKALISLLFYTQNHFLITHDFFRQKLLSLY